MRILNSRCWRKVWAPCLLSLLACDLPQAYGHFDWPRFCLSVREMTSARTRRPSWLVLSLFSLALGKFDPVRPAAAPLSRPLCVYGDACLGHILKLWNKSYEVKIWQLVEKHRLISVFKTCFKMPITLCWLCNCVAFFVTTWGWITGNTNRCQWLTSTGCEAQTEVQFAAAAAGTWHN